MVNTEDINPVLIKQWLEGIDYNEEPVYYCKRCLSLYILSQGDTDFCETCSSTEIATASIIEWDKLYKEKYGKSLIEK